MMQYRATQHDMIGKPLEYYDYGPCTTGVCKQQDSSEDDTWKDRL